MSQRQDSEWREDHIFSFITTACLAVYVSHPQEFSLCVFLFPLHHSVIVLCMEKFSGWRMSLLSPGDVAEWLDSSTEEEKSLLSFLGTVGLRLFF